MSASASSGHCGRLDIGWLLIKDRLDALRTAAAAG
jgi:hypothetical protein